jgi:hypothetical protein
LKKELIQSRKISVNCYEMDEGVLTVEGSLIDERHCPYLIHALNERREAGPMHHIAMTMQLSVPQLKILSLAVEMPIVPDPGCRDVRDTVQRFIGCHIRPGFTSQVREILGKKEGCLHLTNLLLAMGSAAIQGMWSYFSRIRDAKAPPLPPGIDGEMLLNSCHMWREDGPFVQKVKRRRDALRAKESQAAYDPRHE